MIEWLINRNVPAYATNKDCLRFIYKRMKGRKRSVLHIPHSERKKIYKVALAAHAKNRDLFAQFAR